MLRHFSPEGDPLLYGCPCERHTCVAKVNPRLPQVLDLIRDDTGIPMVITSGPRCVPHNVEIGGAEYSEHIDGEGADVQCSNSRDRFMLINSAIKHGINRIGVGKGFLHLGISESNDQFVMWVY